MSTDVGPTTQPKRGEVWNVNFDPSVGAEIRKIRPTVVISSDVVGRLPIKIVAPLTEWKDHFQRNVWHVRLDPDGDNGVTKTSAIDAIQVKSVAVDRFGLVSVVVPRPCRGDCRGGRAGHRVRVNLQRRC